MLVIEMFLWYPFFALVFGCLLLFEEYWCVPPIVFGCPSFLRGGYGLRQLQEVALHHKLQALVFGDRLLKWKQSVPSSTWSFAPSLAGHVN